MAVNDGDELDGFPRGHLWFVATIVLVAGTLAVLAVLVDNSRDGARTDDRGQTAPARYLPLPVPGFELVWVDDRQEPLIPPTGPEPWGTRTRAAYTLGYRSAANELDVEVFPGDALDVDAVVSAWREDGDVRTTTDDSGRRGVVLEADGLRHAVTEVDGAVVRATAHGLGRPESTVTSGLLDGFVRSFRRVDENSWRAALEGVDVAPPTGDRGEGTVLLDDGGWQLVRVPYREPRNITREAIFLRAGGTRTQDWYFADEPALVEDVRWSFFGAGARTVAWGVAPPRTATVRFWFLERTIEATTVPFGNGTAFAVGADVDDPPGSLRQLSALDATGQPIYTLVNPGRHLTCSDGEGGPITVPDVVGIDLRRAITIVEAAGMAVQGTGTGTGTGPEDPIEDATVTAQEPPAGALVPRGSCIGFRTE